jgi:glycosyltransferase involved in cell wall biosynthesis
VNELLVSAFTPTLGTGQALRTYGIVRALTARGQVDLLYARFGAEEPGPEYASMPGLTLHEVVPSRGLRRLAAYVRARSRGVPTDFARGVSPELTAAARQLAGRRDRGRVIADGPVVAAALMRLAAERPVLYNAHNLESRFRHLVGSDSGGLRGLAAFERQLLELMQETWMVSPGEVEDARALAPDASLRYVPNVVDTTEIKPVEPAGGQTALFVGDFTYAPNRGGLSYLVEEVMPNLWRSLPEARLVVAGRGLDHPASDDPRVRQLGFVEDLAGLYAKVDCVAIPLLVGGGSPLKFIEALAYGVPVVATSVAAAGLEASAGEHFLQADRPEELADAMAQVLRGEASDLASRGRDLAERVYSIESLAERLAA